MVKWEYKQTSTLFKHTVELGERKIEITHNHLVVPNLDKGDYVPFAEFKVTRKNKDGTTSVLKLHRDGHPNIEHSHFTHSVTMLRNGKPVESRDMTLVELNRMKVLFNLLKTTHAPTAKDNKNHTQPEIFKGAIALLKSRIFN